MFRVTLENQGTRKDFYFDPNKAIGSKLMAWHDFSVAASIEFRKLIDQALDEASVTAGGS